MDTCPNRFALMAPNTVRLLFSGFSLRSQVHGMGAEPRNGSSSTIKDVNANSCRLRTIQNQVVNTQHSLRPRQITGNQMKLLANVPAALALALGLITAVPAFAADTDAKPLSQATRNAVIERIEAFGNGTFVELIIKTRSNQRLLPLIFSDQGKLIIELDKASLIEGFPTLVNPSGPSKFLQTIAVKQDANGTVRITLTPAGKQELKASISQSDESRVAISIRSGLEMAVGTAVQQDIELVATGDQSGFLDKEAGTALGYKEKVLNTPLSIQSVNQDVLQKQQAITVEEALRNVSSVSQGITFGGINSALDIRGFGGVNGATVQRDGYQLFSNYQGIPEVNNLSRIEVLKGPSSILYGQGEPGGIINLVQKRATGEKFFDLNLQGGSTNGLFRPTLDASGTLNQDGSIAYRIPASYQYFNSYRGFDNAYQKTSTAPTIRWKANEKTEIEFISEYVNNTTPADFGITRFGSGVANVPVSRVTNDPSDTVSNNFYNIGYKINYKLNNDWDLSNGFRYLNYNYNYGVVALPLSLDPSNNALLARGFVTQEFNSNSYSLNTKLTGKFKTGAVEHKFLTSIDLNTSNSYDNFKGDNQQIFQELFFGPSFNVFNPVYGPKPSESALVNATVTQGFSRRIIATLQDQFTIGGKLIALAGVSYNGVYQQGQAKGDLIGTTPFDSSQTFSVWTPRAGLLYKLTDSLSLFANYSTGFAPVNILVGASSVPKPLTSNGYEVGAKASLIGDKLLATLTWFDINRNNVPVADPVNPFGQIQIGSQKSQGIEIDIIGKLAPGLEAIANYSYINAFVANDPNFAGNQLPGIPNNQSNLWLNYTFEKGTMKGLGLGLGYSLVGNRQGNLANTFTVGSYGLLNAALSYEWSEKKYRVALNFNNIGNAKYISGVSTGDTGLQVGSPFAVIGSVGFKF